MSWVKYFHYAVFFCKQLPDYLFSRNPYLAPNGNLKIIFTPRSIDPNTYFEIFIEEQYKISGLSTAKIVIDIGANIGLFTLWAIQNLNAKKVISIEMDETNFKNMTKNIMLNGWKNKVVAINKAFYSRISKVAKISSISPLNTCQRLDERRPGTINTITFAQILSLVKEATIDLIKIDIEGSEKFLLSPKNKHLLKQRVKKYYC